MTVSEIVGYCSEQFSTETEISEFLNNRFVRHFVESFLEIDVENYQVICRFLEEGITSKE